MRFTPPQLVDRGVPLLTGPLAPRHPERLRDVPAAVPASAAFGSFEVRLSGEPRIDFAVVLEAAGRPALAAYDAWVDPDGCAATRRLLEEWLRPESPVHGGVGEVWLTWDLEGRAGDAVRHLPYFGPRAGGAKAARHAMASWLPAVRRGLDLLDTSDRIDWERCLQALPPGGLVGLVASLAPRGRDVVRFTLGLRGDEVLPYLHRVGWPGASGWVDDTLADLHLADQTVPIQLDVGPDGVLPRITLECCWNGTPAQTPAWSPVLAGLAAVGVRPEVVDAVGRWPSPVGPMAARRDEPVQVWRMLDVKFTHEPGRDVEAKAYLGFAPVPVLFS